ncbi:MAG: hypothetical protein QM775_18380 [Pirellulales bacterium]
MSVVSDKPYVPVPPYYGTLWPRALYWYVPRYLRRRYGVQSVQVCGAENSFSRFATATACSLRPIIRETKIRSF